MSIPILTRLKIISKSFDARCYEYDHLKKELSVLKSSQRKVKHMRRCAVDALHLVQEVGTLTQKEATYKIENLVTLALRDVFGKEGYDFRMKVSYGKRCTEVDFFFVRRGEEFDPLECCGYGCVDVACFALRLAVWSIIPSSHVMVFDEPFKNISEEYRQRFAYFVRKICKRLDFQFIISTHMKELMEVADADFFLTKTGSSTTINRTLIRR